MRIRLKFRLDDQVVYGCFSSVQRIGSANSSAVLYTPQELTEEEKTQARKNIGAQDPNLLVVTVDNSNEASHTASEIFEFVNGGGSAVVKYGSNSFYNPISINANTAKFEQSFCFSDSYRQNIITIKADGSATITNAILGSLKNPNAITFTGAVNATYDGSKPVEVVIPEGGNSVHFGEEEPTDAKTGDFWYDESEEDDVDVTQLYLLIETDMLPAVHDEDGKILTDENGKIILRY